MVRVVSLFLGLFLSNMALAQWNINSIPEPLLKNANMVVRRYAVDIKCIKSDKIVVAENFVFTVFEESELGHLVFQSIIGPVLTNEILDTRVYDEKGKRVRGIGIRLDKSEDFGNSSKICIVNDVAKFPLTIELEYKKVLKSLGDIQLWNPIINYNVSLQNASLQLTVIDSSFVRFSSAKLSIPDKSIDEDGNCTYLWELNDFPAIIKGSSKELPQNILPFVKVERIEGL